MPYRNLSYAMNEEWQFYASTTNEHGLHIKVRGRRAAPLGLSKKQLYTRIPPFLFSWCVEIVSSFWRSKMYDLLCFAYFAAK